MPSGTSDPLVPATRERPFDPEAARLVDAVLRTLRSGLPPHTAVQARKPAPAHDPAPSDADRRLADVLAQREESEALAEVARALLGTDTNLPGSLHLLAEHTLKLLDAEGAAVVMLAGDEMRAEAGTGSLASYVGTVAPTARTAAADAIAERRVVIVNETAADLRTSGELAQPIGMRQVIVAPMVVEDNPVGVLMAVNSRHDSFSDSDAALLGRLADHGALAVRNALLFHRAERSAREARALTEIVRNINQSLEVDRVFALVARHATELLEARSARLAMLEGDDLVVVANYGEVQTPRWRTPLRGSCCEPCIDRGVAMRCRDAHAAREIWRWPANCAGANVIAVPLGISSHPLGAIVVLGGPAQDFGDADEELLMALAEHAAVAIENARLYRASVRTMRHASILAASARSLALHVTPQAMYADVWRLACTSLAADGIGIYLADSASTPADLTFSAGIAAEVARQHVHTFWQTSGSDVLPSGRPKFLSSLMTQERGPLAGPLSEVGVASVALLPLMVEGKPRGVLSLRYRIPQNFENEQQRLLIDFASHTAAAVRNALLFADLEQQAVQLRAAVERERREREETEAGAAIARVALRSTGLGTAAGQILEILQAVVPSAASALALRREDGMLRYVAARGVMPNLQGSALSMEEVNGSAVPRLSVAECISHTVLPLVSGDQVIGVLALGSGPSGADEQHRRETLGRLTAAFSLALASLLLREEERRVAEQLRQAERLAALGELVAGVAHEVNNPLTGISAFAQLLQEDELTPEQLESVRLIKKEADRAAAVMRDLLTFARKTGPRLVAVAMNDIIKHTLRLRTYGLRTMGIEVRLELSDPLQRVSGDDRQIQQVLLNLLVNAEHAMAGRSERTITIRSRNDDDHVVVEVLDTGSGMPAEVQRRIFEPFFTTKTDGRGTGLGLSVSYGIIRNHQGSFEVESSPGQGSTFRIRLPVVAPHEKLELSPSLK